MGCGQSQAMPPGAAKSDPKYKPEKPQNENRETEESDNENKAVCGLVLDVGDGTMSSFPWFMLLYFNRERG